MKTPTRLIRLALALASVASLSTWAACAVASSEPSAPEPSSEPRSVVSRVSGKLVPLNGSLVSGTVRAAVEGGELSVVVEAEGLEVQQIHPQHLHGFFGGDRSASCPTVEADADGDQVLSAAEVEPVTGPPLLPLEPFPLPTDERRFRYQASLPIDAASLGPLPFQVVMIHGLTLDGEYQRGLPVACAELEPVQGMAPPPGG